jgi:hypothetical protein
MVVCLFGLFGHLQRRMNELPKKFEECSGLGDICHATISSYSVKLRILKFELGELIEK